MIHTVHLDDTYSSIQGILQEIRSQKHGVQFECNSVDKVIKQEDYMTSEEFRKHATEKVKKFCKEHGILYYSKLSNCQLKIRN